MPEKAPQYFTDFANEVRGMFKSMKNDITDLKVLYMKLNTEMHEVKQGISALKSDVEIIKDSLLQLTLEFNDHRANYRTFTKECAKNFEKIAIEITSLKKNQDMYFETIGEVKEELYEIRGLLKAGPQLSPYPLD